MDNNLINDNEWLKVVNRFQGNEALYDISGKEYIFPGDETFVHEFNKKHSEKHKYVLNTVPYPWLGNPLKARIIILSQNPGWVENSGKVIPLLLQQCPEIAKEIMRFFRETFSLHSNCFMPSDKVYSLGFSPRDAYNAMGDWYWKKRFHFLTEAGVDEETIYDNVAVIQYIPYSSVSYAPLPKDVTLPSQIFARRLIDFIRLNNKETIFVVLRAVKLWSDFLGDIWSDLNSQNRIIEHLDGRYRPQYISPNCLGTDNFNRIVKVLSSNV